MVSASRVLTGFSRNEPNAIATYSPALENLLEKREYDQLSHLLENSAHAVKSNGSPIAASLVSAARQLCQVCIDCQEQKVHHRYMHETAVAREHELRQTLQSILFLLDQSGNSQLSGLSAAELGIESAVLGDSDVQAGFWQRIQLLLGLTPSTATSKETKLPAIVAPEEAAEPGAVDTPTPATGSPPVESNDRESGQQVKNPSIAEMKSMVDVGSRELQPSLVVYCLGPFQAYLDDKPIESWSSGKGKAIFKYLVAHRELPTAKEVLMELFWPEADPDAARNNLNVAIYGLRQALRNGGSPTISHVLFQDDAYLFNPDVTVWVDVEEFQERYQLARKLEQEGDLGAAIPEYFAAETLYQLEFLAEDRYDDWVLSRRQQLEIAYLDLLERLSGYHFDAEDYPACITACHKMLAIDLCREDAHRLLMRCYVCQGQRYLALRQYHLCTKCLREELDVSPASDTITLYEQIRR